MARVLLAEDDVAMLDMVKRALAGDGHAVVAAQDGQEALDIVNAPGAAFDVMLTDIQMPSLDGISLSSKAIAALPKLRIVLMTAYTGGVTVPDQLKPHVVAVLTKPLALDQIRAAVRNAAV